MPRRSVSGFAARGAGRFRLSGTTTDYNFSAGGTLLSQQMRRLSPSPSASFTLFPLICLLCGFAAGWSGWRGRSEPAQSAANGSGISEARLQEADTLHDSTQAALDPQVVSLITQSLASPQPDARAAALKWMARDPRARAPQLISRIFALLKDSEASVRDAALGNMGWIFDSHRGDATGTEALAAIEAALEKSSERSGRLAAVDLLRGSREATVYDNSSAHPSDNPLTLEPGIQALVARLLTDPEASIRPELLGVVGGSPRLRSDPRILDAVASCFNDDDLTVRSQAADLLIKVQQNPASADHAQAVALLHAALRVDDPNVQLRVARALGVPVPPPRPQAPVLSLTGEKVSAAKVPYDFNYFTAFVQPLFIKKYGEAACVDCHTPEKNASGSFRILAPGSRGRYTLEESRVNFVSILSVIDRKNPVKSKLLLKPLNPRASEGSVKGLTHDGGVFWENEFDPDYTLIANWLKGAKLETPPEKQLDFAYFEKYVEPVFSTPGPDGFACINCHSTHAILHLESPETREGKFSIEQIVNNYQSAHRVVDETAPGNSFIVRKPTSPREGEPGGISHAGGIRWPEKKASWQYKALLDWIGRLNLATAPAQAVKTAATPPPAGN